MALPKGSTLPTQDAPAFASSGAASCATGGRAVAWRRRVALAGASLCALLPLPSDSPRWPAVAAGGRGPGRGLGSNLGFDRNGFRAEPNLGNALGSVIR